MRTILLAAAAAIAISTPAAARDGAAYVGVEGGVLSGAKSKFDLALDDGTDEVEFNDAFELDHKTGFDIGLIGGYDFGPARAELELGYKRARIGDIELSDELIDLIEDEDLSEDDFDINGRTGVLSLMGNLLFDVGGNDGVGFYAGGGFGRARANMAGERDSAWAWQLIAGARMPVTDNIDLGMKYRYFNTANLEFRDEADDFAVSAKGKFRSHSLLASITYNFGQAGSTSGLASPPPPPPPAPLPAATQVCADGSVILATDICPAPAAPPPPPAPLPQGERG